MKPLRIAVLNLSETERDPRVRRVSAALGAAGHQVVAINPLSAGREPRSSGEGFDIVRVSTLSAAEERKLSDELAHSPVLGPLLHSLDPLLRFSLRERIQHGLQRRLTRGINRVARRTGLDLGRAQSLVARAEVDALREAARLRWTVLGGLPLFAEALKHRPDLVWCNDTNTLLPGLALKEATGARLVFDAHEAFTEQLPPGEVPSSTLAAWARLEAAVLPHTDARSTVCDAVGRFYQERYGAGPFATIRNVPSLRFLVEPSVLGRRNSPRVAIYQGAYFRFRGLEPTIEAAKYLRRTELHLRGVGEYEVELKKLAAQHGVEDRVRFLPAVKVDELAAAASHADIGLNLFPSLCLNTSFALPNKFFEYLLGGLATASSDLVELRAHTERYGTGVLLPSLEPTAIAEHLDALSADSERLDEYRAAAWNAAKTELHWEKEVAKLSALMESL